MNIAKTGWVASQDLALLTDLYELTMLQAYWYSNMHESATFSLFVRRLPATRNYLLACGIDDALDALAALQFRADQIEFLRSTELFRDEFLATLLNFRFTGDVFAVEEGTPLFAEEPIIEVIAPVAEAQLIETLVMNQVHLQTVIASKAARVVTAARGRPVVDFGLRRAHGFDAGLKLARASYLAGAHATSNVLAGHHYSIPLAGTMAHSFVQAFDREADAFRTFARLYPQTTLLVDTYDTMDGVQKVIELASELGAEFSVSALRLDSGDLAGLAQQARARLDAAGLNSVQLFASGGLDEFDIQQLLEHDAPLDGFGVGTRLAVSQDAPALDIAYKLTSYAGRDRVKLSPDKQSLPGRKQVFRNEQSGRAINDVIARFGESLPGRPLLTQVMSKGARTQERRSLSYLRRSTHEQIASLPAHVRALEPAQPPYHVSLSPEVIAATRSATDQFRE